MEFLQEMHATLDKLEALGITDENTQGIRFTDEFCDFLERYVARHYDPEQDFGAQELKTIMQAFDARAEALTEQEANHAFITYVAMIDLYERDQSLR